MRAQSARRPTRRPTKSYKPGVPDTVSNSLDIDFFDIAVLVNATADPNDDYVVKKLPASLQRTPRNPLAGANGPSGKPDNHIPLQLKLTGPTGKKLKLKLGSTTSGGTLSFKKSDGGDYPADGIEVTAGNNLDARLYGETASTALEDAVIKVTGDRTGDAKWGQTATVIWVPGEDMKFRGTNDQGNPFSPNSEAQLTGSVYPPEVGHLRSATDGSRIGNHEEIEMVPYPKVLIPNVSWDLARQISRAAWYNGAAPPSYNGPGGWNDDGPTAVNYDEDSTQQANKLSLYTVDVPGPGSNPLAHTDTYTYKGKWHEWAEVQIGGKWYICSDYIYWRSIMHLKSNAAGTRWIDKPGTVNEVVRGTIDGWANTWSEENPAPSVTSIAPNTGVQGNTVTVTNLAGTNFVANATIVLARAGEVDIPATDVEWQTATKYTCKFVLPATAAVGDWDVKVTNIDNPNTATKSNAFSITTVP